MSVGVGGECSKFKRCKLNLKIKKKIKSEFVLKAKGLFAIKKKKNIYIKIIIHRLPFPC